MEHRWRTVSVRIDSGTEGFSNQKIEEPKQRINEKGFRGHERPAEKRVDPLIQSLNIYTLKVGRGD